ncbi:MAG: hypothetical protein IJJ44_07630 [Solobacterium sp.]|nr:hypothetical protein [Solobacterium sp.]
MNIKHMLPYLESEELLILARNVLKSEDLVYQGISLKEVLHYIDEDDLGEVLRSLNEEELERVFADESVIKPLIRKLDEDDLADLAEKITPAHPSLLAMMAPCLDEDDLCEIAVDLMKLGVSIDLTALIPFLDEDGTAECIRCAAEIGEDISSLLNDYNVIKNMDEDDLADIVKDIVPENPSLLVKFALFLDEDDVGEIAVQLVRNHRSVNLMELLPFMDEDSIDTCFRYALIRNENWQEYLPFVSKDALHKLMKDYMAGKITADFDLIYPFMDEDDIRTLFRYEMNKQKR